VSSKNSKLNSFGDKLLEQEDNAGYFSYKRAYLVTLRYRYIYKKLKYHILTIIILSIITLIFIDNTWQLNNLTGKLVALILIFWCSATTLILLLVRNKTHHDEIKKFLEIEFDKAYGEGQYIKTIENINSKKIS